MYNRSLERTLYLTVILVLFMCLIVIILLNMLNIDNIDFSNPIWNPLSTFLGALIGAGITGGIALYITEKDKKYRIKEKNEEVIDNFNKSFELLKMWSSAYLQTYEEVYNLSLGKSVDLERLEREAVAIKSCLSKFESINDDYIPAAVYKNFLDLKSIIEFTMHLSNAWFSSYQYAEPSVRHSKSNESIRNIRSYYPETTKSFQSNYNQLQNYFESINSKRAN